MTLNAVDFLPKVQIDASVMRKILSNIEGNRSRGFSLFGAQYSAKKVDPQKFELVYNLDELSYNTDEGFEQYIYINKIIYLKN